jgi:adenylate cyclase
VRRLLTGLAIGAVSAAVVAGVDLAFDLAAGVDRNPLHSIELKTYDWRLARTADPASARKDIALVEIDEYSLRNLEPQTGRWPWPRTVHAMLIDYLARGPAKVIAYDVVFAGADPRRDFAIGDSHLSGAESDQALVDSVKTAGSVVLPVDATYESGAEQDGALPGGAGFAVDVSGAIERRVVFPPFGSLPQVAAGLGHNLFVIDADGVLRHTIPFVRSKDVAIPSLGLLSALRAENVSADAVHIEGDALRVGNRVLPLARHDTFNADGRQTYQRGLIDFRGPPLLDDLKSRPYPSYSAFDLIKSETQLLADETPDVDPAVFKDKLVFVGVSATGLRDVFQTPFAGGQMPGPQVHASVADDLLSNRFLAPVSRSARIFTVVSLALVAGVVAAWAPAWWATMGVAVLVASFIVFATRMFAVGYWWNVSQPFLASALALFGGVGYQYVVEGREKRKMKRLFGQYVSKDVYAQLVANPELARLGGQRREMTVLFSDIRGFTTVTERGEPEEIVGMLNEYFSRMVEIVFRHKGTVDKFVGDMVMALFNAPLDDPAHADHAVAAALDMIEQLHRLNAQWKVEGRFAELDIGIGINTGPMIAGNIGSDAIMSYTVIGDAVNLGARLESLNKQYGTRIIISDATRRSLSGRYTLKPLGDVVVKGKSQAVAIFEVSASGQGAENEGLPVVRMDSTPTKETSP